MVSQRQQCGPQKRQDAPNRLELIRAFINTWNLELGTDTLSDPDGLRTWLSSHGLLDPSVMVTEQDRTDAVQVREALRSLARHNMGRAIDLGDSEVLNRLSREADVRIRYGTDGLQTLAPRQSGDVRCALGTLLAVVATATIDGTWRRLKVCAAEDCLWAFYDHSRNRSGVWCQMAECGNRAKVRAYRDRYS